MITVEVPTNGDPKDIVSSTEAKLYNRQRLDNGQKPPDKTRQDECWAFFRVKTLSVNLLCCFAMADGTICKGPTRCPVRFR